MAAIFYTFVHILAREARKNLILVSIPMFSGSRYAIIDYFTPVRGSHLESKNGHHTMYVYYPYNVLLKHIEFWWLC